MNQNELMHYGVPGMKWGHRKNYYGSSGDKYRASNGVTVGAPKNAGVAAFRKAQESKAGAAAIKGIAKLNTAMSGCRNKTTMKRIGERTRKETDAVREANQVHKQAKKEQKQPMSTKKKVAIGAAVVGTALAAYGTYKLAKFAQDKRSKAAIKKGSDYMRDNILTKYGESKFSDGKIISNFRNNVGTEITIGSKNSSAINKYNDEVINKAYKITKDATNTRLDKGLSKVVNAGNSVGKVTEQARNNIKNAGRTVGNKILDVVNPMYEYTPGSTTSSTRSFGNGVTMTKTTTDLIKRKVKRR